MGVSSSRMSHGLMRQIALVKQHFFFSAPHGAVSNPDLKHGARRGSLSLVG